jgi:hypothetical protein
MKVVSLTIQNIWAMLQGLFVFFSKQTGQKTILPQSFDTGGIKIIERYMY